MTSDMYGSEGDKVIHNACKSVFYKNERLHTETRRQSNILYMADQAHTTCWNLMKLDMHVITRWACVKVNWVVYKRSKSKHKVDAFNHVRPEEHAHYFPAATATMLFSFQSFFFKSVAQRPAL